MTAPIFFPDVEGAARTWLRSRPLLDVVGGRVFFGLPPDTAYPAITVARIGGGPAEGLVPLDNARLSFGVWGGNKHEAADVAGRLVTELVAMESEPLDGSVQGLGATVDSVLWLPDPATARARYVVDATLTVSALVSVP